MAPLVFLRYLGEPPGLFLPGAAQPLLEHGLPVAGSRGQPSLDPGDRVRVVGGGAVAFRLVRVADLGGQHLAAGASVRVDQPVCLSDSSQQVVGGGLSGKRPRCVMPVGSSTGKPLGEGRREEAARRPVHPPLGLLLELILGRQLVADQRADPDHRMPHQRRLAGQIDPPVIHRKRVPDAGGQDIGTGPRGCGPGQNAAPGITRGQDAFGRLRQDRVPEREQGRPVLPADIGIGGDLQLLLEPVGVAQDRRQNDVGGVSSRFPQATFRRDVPQPERQRRIRHPGSSPTRPSRAARLVR